MKKLLSIFVTAALLLPILSSCTFWEKPIEDQMTVVYADAFGFYGNDTFVVYPDANVYFSGFPSTISLTYKESKLKDETGEVDYTGGTFYYRYRLEEVEDFEVLSPRVNPWEIVAKKPVIYLYPEETTTLRVKLTFAGRLTETIPYAPTGEWEVTASPDGTLTVGGAEYPYLFWEGVPSGNLDLTDEGYCVAGADTADFLADVLSQMGLNESESSAFIEYWLPEMQTNNYNIIRFHGKDYTDMAPLSLSVTPDSVLRVFMSYRASEEPVEMTAPVVVPFSRVGFTLVEWGGCRLP